MPGAARHRSVARGRATRRGEALLSLALDRRRGLGAGGAPPSDLPELSIADVGKSRGANFSRVPSSGCMPTVSGHHPSAGAAGRLGADTTRSLLEAIAVGSRGERLRATVAAWNRGATQEQVDEAFQEACARAAQHCRGQSIGEVYVWLRTTTHRHLSEMREQGQREIPVDISSAVFESSDASFASPPDVLIEREDRAEVRRVMLGMIGALAERERQIAVLHSRGLARNEIARHLGITPRMVKRSVEEILRTGRDQLVRLTGFGCADGHELVSRYAFGLVADREARSAQAHLTTCARCGAMYERLDLWRDRVAALLPVPPAVGTQKHLAERVIHASSDAISSGHANAGAGAGGWRRHVANVFRHVRDRATATDYRTVDPTPLAGVRPGAVAAAVAGCLAVGGGATYCVQQGSNPFRALAGMGEPATHVREKSTPRHRPKPEHDRARAAQATVPPTVTPTETVVAPQSVQSTPTPPPPTTTTPPAPPPAPQDQFEPTSSGTGQAPAPASTAKPKQPAPASATGASEFGGP